MRILFIAALTFVLFPAIAVSNEPLPLATSQGCFGCFSIKTSRFLSKKQGSALNQARLSVRIALIVVDYKLIVDCGRV